MDLAGAAAGAIVHKVRPGAEELVADLDDLIAAQGEPFGSTSIYAQYRVFQRPREAASCHARWAGCGRAVAGYLGFPDFRLLSLMRRAMPVRWRDSSTPGELIRVVHGEPPCAA